MSEQESASLKYSVCQFSGKTDKFDFFDPNLLKNRFWGRNFEKLHPDAESVPPRYHECKFSGKTDNFEFFGPNLPKKEFQGQNFKILSLDSESAHLLYHQCQFLGKMDNFEYSASIWGNCPITCDILVIITLRVLQRAGWRLKLAGWRWVHGLVIPGYNLIRAGNQNNIKRGEVCIYH